MKIKYLAHSSFLITSDPGTKIVTDPYTSGQGLGYAPVNESAEAVTISHEHGDHNNEKSVKGSPRILRGEGAWRIGSLEIKGVAAFHDQEKGAQRGKDTIFCFSADGVNICHLGDLGEFLSDKQIESIGKVDALLVPVGGFYTIDAEQAWKVALSLNPRIVIPMHYKTPKCEFPLAVVDVFLKGKPRVHKLASSELKLSKSELPAEMEIRVLPYSQ